MLNLKDEEYIKRHAEIANTLSYFSNRTSSLALMGIGRIIDSIDIQKTGYRLFKQYAPPMDITLPL
ncbi:hypothetical protein JCM19233_6116 [Vibrio astriarenae]|nr:hypothetical protein JCM19233_6116 [Vibrio sp. C7]